MSSLRNKTALSETARGLFVNLCNFSSTEVGKPLQRQGQDIRCSMDCETFGRRHFLFAPAEKRHQTPKWISKHELIYRKNNPRQRKCRVVVRRRKTALTWHTCRRSLRSAHLVLQTVPKLAQCLLLADRQKQISTISMLFL